jgi:hypothetical protein
MLLREGTESDAIPSSKLYVARPMLCFGEAGDRGLRVHIKTQYVPGAVYLSKLVPTTIRNHDIVTRDTSRRLSCYEHTVHVLHSN